MTNILANSESGSIAGLAISFVIAATVIGAMSLWDKVSPIVNRFVNKIKTIVKLRRQTDNTKE